MDRWKQVGVVGVDSGRLLITDYPEHPTVQWDEVTKKLVAANFPHVLQLLFEHGRPGAGVSVSTGLGDGLYPVYVKVGQVGCGDESWGERVKEIKIVFIPHPVLEERYVVGWWA